MSNIRSKNTKPELMVRSIAHNLGYRFRLHVKNLPGKPDLVFPKHKKVIFVNGCFWHMHRCRYGKVKPKTNIQFWKDKRNATVVRDKMKRKELRQKGWQVLTIWECWTRNPAKVIEKLNDFFNTPA